jgi:hypothetical protein
MKIFRDEKEQSKKSWSIKLTTCNDNGVALAAVDSRTGSQIASILFFIHVVE